MASLAIQVPGIGRLDFDEVEQDVTFMDLGVRLANRFGTFKRLIAKSAVLTMMFDETVRKQQELVSALMRIQHETVGEVTLLELAKRIEHLVALNDDLLTAAPGRFAPWTGYFSSLRKQRECLDSMAETFRMSADAHVRQCITSLAAQADAESENGATESDWREFVASLHD
jgi:hypothetical protein